MLFKRRESGKKYYGDNYIVPKIFVDSFLWNENEKLDFFSVAEFIEKKDESAYLYLITTRVCFYPIGSKDKNLKLWKWVFKEFDLNLNDNFEKEFAEDRWIDYIGIASVPRENIEKALKLLQRNFSTSCIILSNVEKNLDEILDMYLKLFYNRKSNCVDFARLINTLGVDNDIITAITGYNGCSINYFYFEDM